MADAELLFRSATELAQLIRSGEVLSRELTELALAQIEQQDPQLGAFVQVEPERALEAADQIKPGDERPFAGVPTAVKDIGPFLAGYRYTAGASLFGDFTPDFDSNATARIKNAGFVITGKTKTPEMGILPVTEPTRYGPARNPYDLDRTPGGSSGGSAAAVAAGLLPVAHGNDGGGSLRIPGACCGLIGFKCSRGRISAGPLQGESPLTTEGFLARSVADVAATLDLLSGYEPGDSTWAPPPSVPFVEAAKRDPGRLKIGFTTKPPAEVAVDPLHEQAVAEMAKKLEELGHDVEEVDVPWDNPALILSFTQLFSAWISSLTNFAATVSGSEVNAETVEPLTLGFHEMAAGLTALDFIMVNTTVQALTRGIIAATYQYDAILSPTLAQRPVPIGTMDGTMGMEAFAKAAEFTPYTALMNVSGQPAVSVPTGLGPDGLPVAVQFIGRPAGEETLFSLIGQLERAVPWAGLRPAAVAA